MIGSGAYEPFEAEGGRIVASVNRAVGQLAGLGIVTAAGARARDRLFVAPDVIALFESPPHRSPRVNTPATKA